MKHIKKFEQLNENNDSYSFSDEKEDILDFLRMFIDRYDSFTKNVSPSKWRVTGSHFSQLRKMQEDIEGFTEITEKDKENPWVRDALEGTE